MSSTASVAPAGKRARPCPVLNGPISAADCGRQRGRRLACPASCPFYPFAPAGYELWLKVEAEWFRKALDRVVRVWGRDRLRAQMKWEELPLDAESAVVEAALNRALHRLLFHETGPEGRSVAETWEAAGWTGLNNDEQVMTRHRRATRLALLEVQRVRSERELECVDLLEPARPPFLVLDRQLAPRVVRFTRLLTGLTDYPHFAAPVPPTLEVPPVLWSAWWAWLRQRAGVDAGPAAPAPPDLRAFLDTHLREAVERLNELHRDHRAEVFDQMGLFQYLARHRLEEPAEALAAALREHPAFRPADLPPLPQLGPPLAAFEWRDATAPSPAPTLADQPDPARDPQVLGVFRLYPGFLVVETNTRARHARAREFVEREFAGRVHFLDEAQIDLSHLLQTWRQRAALVAAAENAIFGTAADPEGPEAEARTGAVAAPAPTAPPAAEPEPTAEQLRAEHEARYRQLLDRALPELDGLTPRQAVADPVRRPRVVELFKTHLYNLERRNRREPVPLSLDWVVEELGLVELR